jgi:ubiquinone/menaquinone biosynthesis C-methylase UbiE
VKDAEAKKVYKKYVLYDGNVIPFADNEFSTVISNCVLEHLPHLSTNLNEISRVLKKKGYFLTSVMTDKWEKYMFGSSVAGNWYRQFMRTKQDHVNLLSADGWREQFQRAGFQVVEEIGYVSPSNARYLDIFHYLSFPSLVSYKLFNKWVPFPQLNNLLKLENLITSLMEVPTEIDKSSAVFYVLEKK